MKRKDFIFVTLMLSLSSVSQAQNAEQKYPNILSAKVTARGGNTFDFDVTLSSIYDTPKRYADAFKVSDKQGKLLGERVLFHDHQTEQPFTRDLYGVKIPAGVKHVVIQGRDQKYGYGGATIELTLPGR